MVCILYTSWYFVFHCISMILRTQTCSWIMNCFVHCWWYFSYHCMVMTLRNRAMCSGLDIISGNLMIFFFLLLHFDITLLNLCSWLTNCFVYSSWYYVFHCIAMTSRYYIICSWVMICVLLVTCALIVPSILCVHAWIMISVQIGKKR